jgi:acyl carrier protein
MLIIKKKYQLFNMEKKIILTVSKIFKKKHIGLKDSPRTIQKWDSLGHLELISSLNRLFKIEISFEDTIKIKNVADVIKVCKKYKK